MIPRRVRDRVRDYLGVSEEFMIQMDRSGILERALQDEPPNEKALRGLD